MATKRGIAKSATPAKNAAIVFGSGVATSVCLMRSEMPAPSLGGDQSRAVLELMLAIPPIGCWPCSLACLRRPAIP